jgi:hypothetical protein
MTAGKTMKVNKAFFHCVRLLLAGLVMIAATVLARAQPATVQTEPPPPAFSEMLIKNTLVALNQANLTGNYSVLRELGSSQFQASSSTAKLSEVFAQLRKDRLDMSGIVLLKPELTGVSRQDNQLRLTGYFPSEPVRIMFDAAYINIGDGLRLQGLAVRTGTDVAAPAIRGGEQPASRSDFGVSP